MIVAFTGPSFLLREQELTVVKVMEDMNPSELDTWRSGCALGVDTIAAHQAVLAGILNVELYVPAADHNEELVSELTGRVKITRCPESARGSYRVRNEMMVRGADLLVAFLKSYNFYRSGEWMTVNIAKRMSVPIEMFEI